MELRNGLLVTSYSCIPSHDRNVTALKLSLSTLVIVKADYVFADYYIALYIGAIVFLNPDGRDLSQ